MTAYLPVQGASVPFYLHYPFDPNLAFASGWNYFYAFSLLVSAEVSATAVVVDY